MLSYYFDHWFYTAQDFLIDFQAPFERGRYNKAAFELHQATEHFYATLLLVLIDYKPRTHHIERLGSLAAAQEPILLEVFPKGSEEERDRFELLKEAYIKARYDEGYKITKEEVLWLAESPDRSGSRTNRENL